VKTEHGYYRLKEMRSREELQKYYSGKYYQESKGSYQPSYPEEEKRYFFNKIEQKFTVATGLIKKPGRDKPHFLDVGCGEGWALKYFKNKAWEVLGLDYSMFGCKSQNPDCAENVQVGEIEEKLATLKGKGECFDVVLLDNVLEHVLDPLALLELCRAVVSERGVLIVEVPNDFSVLQRHVYEKKYIDRPFWIAKPDHVSYFDKDGLVSLGNAAGWDCKSLMGDFPIDMNLFNAGTNYVKNPAVGKDCHRARIEIENLMHDISLEKVVALYTILAEMGIGRELVAFFQRKGAV